MNYSVKASSDFGAVDYKDEIVTFKASRDAEEAFYQLSFQLTDWEEDAFVFAPAEHSVNKNKRIILDSFSFHFIHPYL
jgi:hypothetical protein